MGSGPLLSQFEICGISEQPASKIAAHDCDGAFRSVCCIFLRSKGQLKRSFTLNAKIFSSSTTKQVKVKGKTVIPTRVGHAVADPCGSCG